MLARADATGNALEFEIAMFSAAKRRQCGAVDAIVTYKKRVFEIKAKDGEMVSVYEAQVETFTVFVPLHGWKQESI